MGDISRLFKPHILAASPYNPTAILRILYQARPEYARLMGNELPFGISPKARQAIIKAIDRAHWYPDSSYHDLKQALSRYTGFPDTHLAVGNGSTQFIDAIYHGFLRPGDAVLFCPPDYGPYRIRLHICGGRFLEAPRPPPDYPWEVDRILEVITPETSVVVVVSPNNPVGNCIGEDDLRRLLEEDVLVVLDEAYYEFADGTLAHLVHDYSNLLCLRTLSKAFGMAGLRMGYAIAQPKLAAYLSKVIPHFSVNALAAAAAIAALGDTEYLEFVRREIREGRAYLERELSRISGLRVFHSMTNFILCQITRQGLTSDNLTLRLAQRGILVRDYTGKPGLEGHGQFIRITVGTMDQNQALVREISDLLSK